MFQVVKRDGEIDNFRIDKITKAIKKAYDATEKQFSDDMLDMLALHVTSDFQKKIKKGKSKNKNLSLTRGFLARKCPESNLLFSSFFRGCFFRGSRFAGS